MDKFLFAHKQIIGTRFGNVLEIFVRNVLQLVFRNISHELRRPHRNVSLCVGAIVKRGKVNIS